MGKQVAEGVTLRNGQRLKYTLNGHLAFWVSLLAVTQGSIVVNEDWSIASFGPLDLTVLYDEYFHLITAACVISFVLAVYLYATSFKPGALLAGIFPTDKQYTRCFVLPTRTKNASYGQREETLETQSTTSSSAESSTLASVLSI